MKITNHHELRKRVTIDCSQPQLTDQSFKKQCDINLIMKQYEKTGMLPQQTISNPRYIDNTNIPTLEDAFNITNQAMEAFYTLPPTIRRLMDNDASQLENFISNPENHDLLKKHGVIVEKQHVKPDATLNDVIETLKNNHSKTE